MVDLGWSPLLRAASPFQQVPTTPVVFSRKYYSREILDSQDAVVPDHPLSFGTNSDEHNCSVPHTPVTPLFSQRESTNLGVMDMLRVVTTTPVTSTAGSQIPQTVPHGYTPLLPLTPQTETPSPQLSAQKKPAETPTLGSAMEGPSPTKHPAVYRSLVKGKSGEKKRRFLQVVSPRHSGTDQQEDDPLDWVK